MIIFLFEIPRVLAFMALGLGQETIGFIRVDAFPHCMYNVLNIERSMHITSFTSNIDSSAHDGGVIRYAVI